MFVEFQKQGIVFDGMLYYAYPLEVQEICRDSVCFLGELLTRRLIREYTGKITFYLDSVEGMGADFQQYLRDLGVGEITTKKVQIQLSNREMEHWFTPYFLAPLLQHIQYQSNNV